MIFNTNFVEALKNLMENDDVIIKRYEVGNVKNNFIYKIGKGEYSPCTEIAKTIVNEKGLVPYSPYLAKFSNGIVSPWTPTNEDIFANDWCVFNLSDIKESSIKESEISFYKEDLDTKIIVKDLKMCQELECKKKKENTNNNSPKVIDIKHSKGLSNCNNAEDFYNYILNFCDEEEKKFVGIFEEILKKIPVDRLSTLATYFFLFHPNVNVTNVCFYVDTLGDMSDDQFFEIIKGLASGVDVNLYCNIKKYNAKQMKEIRLGLEHKVDTSIYSNPEYRAEAMAIIREILETNKWF